MSHVRAISQASKFRRRPAFAAAPWRPYWLNDRSKEKHYGHGDDDDGDDDDDYNDDDGDDDDDN
jgi:hypothetical protein